VWWLCGAVTVAAVAAALAGIERSAEHARPDAVAPAPPSEPIVPEEVGAA
jgi:hypothetical protein